MLVGVVWGDCVRDVIVECMCVLLVRACVSVFVRVVCDLYARAPTLFFLLLFLFYYFCFISDLVFVSIFANVCACSVIACVLHAACPLACVYAFLMAALCMSVFVLV